ncbi:hypothetical protein [Stenotrophomonas tumulicola]|uniref:Uncharacterized protein n=1 Tax=Stenotrophomonas tumulicola TaxID=1685415 RepID=A0A7W3FMM5_9GAMM|nr:hypothetical protein [Stenotrophomonas tumulicola]MBA8682066.1 hypothetical protein [Stenotrophomonas tumulicola]
MLQINTTSQANIQYLRKELPALAGGSLERQDAAQAARAADHLVREDGGRRTATGAKARPDLAAPAAGALSAVVMPLLPAIHQMQHDNPDGAEVRALADLRAQAYAASHHPSLQGWDGEHALSATLPGGERLALPTRDELLAAKGLLRQAPALENEVDGMSKMSDAALLQGFKSDPRFAYILLMVTMLLKLAASQREQGAAMVTFADKSVQEMGQRMIGAAEERRTGAIVGLAVAATVGAAGVGLGAYAAAKNVKSIRTNEKTANAAQSQAEQVRVANARDAAAAPAGRSATDAQRAAAGDSSLHNQAMKAHTEHTINMTQNGVMQQGGYAISQMSQSTAQIANAEYDVKAADQTRQQEIERNNSDTFKSTSRANNEQQVADDEVRKDSLRKFEAMVQENVDTLAEMIRKI